MPRRLGLFALPLVALALLLPTGFAEPRDGWNLAARVPASTLAFAGAEDLHRWGERLRQTAVGQMMDDPSMQGFLAPLRQALKDLGQAQQLPEELRALLEQVQSLRGQAAVAFLGMGPEREVPLLVASLDFGPKVGDFAAFLARMAEQLAKHDLRLESTTRDGRAWFTLALPHGPTLTATTVDTAFVVATDAGLLAQVVAGGAAGSLAESPEFTSTLARLSREGLGMMVYANVQALLATFARGLDGKERRLADALGLDTLKSVAYGMSFAGDGFRDTLLINTPGADHGLATMFGLAPMDRPRFLPLVPGNAFLYEEGNVSLGNLLSAVRKVAAMVEEDAPRELDEGLAHIDQVLGVSLEKDVLAGLGGTLGWYASLPQGGGLYPEVALMATVKDPAAYEQVLTRLNEGIAGALNEDGDVLARPRTITFEGQTLHLFELQSAHGREPVPFTPSWTLLGDRLVITLVPYTLKEIVWRAKHADEAGPGLEAEEDFRALWRLRPEKAGAVEYLDLQAVLSLLYDTAVPLLQTVVKPNVMRELSETLPLDWSELPPARLVRRYFRSLMAFGTWTPDGMELRMHAPIPLLPVVAAVAAGAGMFMARRAEMRFRPGAIELPMEAPMEEPPMEEPVPDAEALTVKARADLDELTRYVRLYLLEQNALPKGLDDLVKQGFLDALPRDPWDRPYRLLVLDAAAKRFQLVSDGPDGKPGTPDDLSEAPR